MLFVRFKRLSFTQQLILPIAVVGSLVLGGIAFLAAQDTFHETEVNAIAKTLETGKRYAEQVKSYIDKPFAQAETFGRSLDTQIRHNMQSRQRSYHELREMLIADPNYLATWSAWEPNAFDGKDAEFANTELHEQSGRYYPWWIRQGEKLTYKTLLNPETPDLGDWYFKPMEAKSAMLTEPYSDTIDGKRVVMTSAIYTIVRDHKAVGLVGVDLSLGTVMDLVSEIKPYEDSLSYLVADTGMVVAGPKEDEIMKPFAAVSEVKDLIASGKGGSVELTTDRGNELFMVVPVEIYNLPQKWTLIIQTPKKTILASAYASMWRQTLISILGLMALMGVVYWKARTSSRKITGLSQELSTSSSSVQSSIHQLNATGLELAESSAKAAASIEESAASLKELTSMVKINTQNAQQAADLSQESTSLARDGESKVRRLISTMTEIEKSSHRIEEIIQIIDDIAFQTNLLALNASVEAARAGDHGKGFAVVAEAVRSLAQRSASSAKDISSLIVSSVEQIKEGSTAATEGGKVLQDILASTDKVASLNKGIAQASKEQADGIELISTAMGDLDFLIRKNAAQAEEISKSSDQIKEQSSVMTSTVRFLSGKSPAT